MDRDNPPHIRHCFDYIRQALMCSADATLEPVDAVLGGVTGWSGIHVCRDFSELAAWAESHRVNNLRGFRETHEAQSPCLGFIRISELLSGVDLHDQRRKMQCLVV